MKNIALSAMLALPLLAGCTTTEQEARKNLGYRGESLRSVEDVSGCVIEDFKKVRGTLTTTDPIKDGIAVKMHFTSSFGVSTIRVADIYRSEGKTILEARGVGGKSKNPEKDYAEYIACLRDN